MTTQREALQAVRVACQTLTSVPANVGLQDGPRPSTGHMRLVAITDVDLGLPQRVDDTTLHQYRAVTLQIDGIGEAGVAALQMAAALLCGDHPVTRALSAAGIAVQTVGPLRDLTAILGSNHEPRQSCDVTVGYRAVYASTPASEATAIVVSLEAQGAIEVEIDPLATIAIP